MVMVMTEKSLVFMPKTALFLSKQRISSFGISYFTGTDRAMQEITPAFGGVVFFAQIPQSRGHAGGDRL
jgi:hypothetical protein